jgi:tetratricopeptide (TPR) repeat protein
VKKITLLLIFLFIAIKISYADDFIDASNFYKNSEYSKALEIYKKYEDNANPYILYNIGNCYYKMNNKAEALAYYIKTFNLNPRVSGLKENLIKTATENGNELFSEDIPQILYSIYYSMSKYEIITFFEIFFIALVILLLLKSKNKISNINNHIFILIIITAIFGTWYILRKNSVFDRCGVIIEDTDLYSGPSNTFQVVANIPKGRIIEILSEKNDFIEVGVPKENIKGWLESKNLIKSYMEAK